MDFVNFYMRCLASARTATWLTVSGISTVATFAGPLAVRFLKLVDQQTVDLILAFCPFLVGILCLTFVPLWASFRIHQALLQTGINDRAELDQLKRAKRDEDKQIGVKQSQEDGLDFLINQAASGHDLFDKPSQNLPEWMEAVAEWHSETMSGIERFFRPADALYFGNISGRPAISPGGFQNPEHRQQLINLKHWCDNLNFLYQRENSKRSGSDK